jgi:hypothetical protein
MLFNIDIQVKKFIQNHSVIRFVYITYLNTRITTYTVKASEE